MKLETLKLASAVAVLSAVMAGCSPEGDVTNVDIDAPTTTNTTNNTTNEGDNGGNVNTGISDCPDFTTAQAINSEGLDVCELPARIYENRTLDAGKVWLIDGVVEVGNGNLAMSSKGVLADGDFQSAVLTIAAGADIRASQDSDSRLIITRGSQIMAEGTAEAPIVFSSEDAGTDGRGEWGGLVIHGYAPQNDCDTVDTDSTVCNYVAEAESGIAGGVDYADNSGVLKYVIVAEGGYVFTNGDEANGISLMSVGSGTTMEYIQVDSNADDGVEFYGGTVNAKYVVVTGAGDDSLDWDEGFQGSLQYVLVKQTAESDGNTIEADTKGSTAWDSKPFVMNATFISEGNRVHRLKEATGAFVFNSIMTGGEDCFRINGSDTVDQIGTSLVYQNVVVNCTNLVSSNSEANAEATFIGHTTTVTSADPALTDAYASTEAVARLAGVVDITPFANAGTTDADLLDDLTADTSFLTATDYLGAVEPGTAAADAWFAGWTLEGTL